MEQRKKIGKELDLESLVSEDYTAVLLITEDDRFSFKMRNKITHAGYRGDIIGFDSNDSAEEYFTGITSDFLPELSEAPSFLVIVDLCTQKLNCLSLLNLHLTFPEARRKWFSFMVCGDCHDSMMTEHALMYYSVLNFELRDNICSGSV